MSTRKAKDDSVFHQSRYASSPEFKRGLLANLVAKRCALIDDAALRELIWFIQYQSHQDGGLEALAKELRGKFPDRIQTREMAGMNLKPGKICNADQVRKLRAGMESDRSYLLKGEVIDCFLGGIRMGSAKSAFDHSESDREAAANNPASYPAEDFFRDCHQAASEQLERRLGEICLDPMCELTESGPWYFPRLTETLREYKDAFIKNRGAGIVTTVLGEKVCEVLDYTFYSRGLTLMQGEARTGKSFAARVWCEQHPGVARFVEVPASNDDASFFRALARGLGLGNFLQYKVAEIRERVESVLLSRDILLVLDEAQRLWPQRNLRYGFPARIVWVMTMANAGVPMSMVATPQFILTQKALERKGWNSSQLTGRISHYESLPVDLSQEDLVAVAKAVLPEADSKVLRALAIYARSSARYLAAIDSISKRARYIAMRDGRDAATTEDVRKAMQESVIPADTKLHLALANGKKNKLGELSQMPPILPPAPEPESTQDSPPPLALGNRRNLDHALLPTAPPAHSRGTNEAVLIGH